MPWYILEYLDQGDKFINGFLLKHNLHRFKAPLESHSGSFLYYIPVLILGFIPFTTALIESLIKVKKLFSNRLFLYLFIWFAFVFVFFSFSGTKLPHYVIYGYTPLFIFIGYFLAQKEILVTYSFILPTAILLIILIALPNLVPFVKVKNSFVAELLSGAKEIFNLKYQLFGIALLTILLVLPKIKLKEELKLTILVVLFGAYLNFVVIKAYANLAQQPIKDAALFAKNRGYKVILYHFNRPSFLVYLQSKSLHKKPEVGDYLLTRKNTLANFKKYSVKYSKNGVYLVRITE